MELRKIVKIGRIKLRFYKKKPNKWYYEMHDLGLNYRITDFQCSWIISVKQIKKDT